MDLAKMPRILTPDVLVERLTQAQFVVMATDVRLRKLRLMLVSVVVWRYCAVLMLDDTGCRDLMAAGLLVAQIVQAGRWSTPAMMDYCIYSLCHVGIRPGSLLSSTCWAKNTAAVDDDVGCVAVDDDDVVELLKMLVLVIDSVS